MPFFKKKLSEAHLQGSLDFKELTDPTYFLENHPDAVYTLNLAGEIVSFNQKLAFLLGYEGTTLANQPIQSFLRPSEAERIAPFKQRALHGETVHFTAEVRHKDGRRLTMTVTNIPIYQNHIIIGLYGIARDISQHVALRKQLLRLAQQEQLTEVTTPIAFLDYLPASDEWSFSKNFTSLLSISSHRLASMDEADFLGEIHPDDRSLFQEHVAQLTTPSNVSLTLRMNQQEQYQRVVRCDALSSRTDDHLCISMMFHDTATTRETPPADSQDSLTNFLATVETIVYQHSEADQALTFLAVGFLQQYPEHLRRLELDSAYWKELLHPDDRDRIKAAREGLQQGETVRLTYRLKLEDEWRWLEEIRLPLKDSNTQVFTGYQGVVTDITLVKQQQEDIFRLSRHHATTGLPNRIALLEKMEDLLENGLPFSIFAIDFNQFHKINTQLGYEIGQRWLLDTRDALMERLPNVYCGHLEGDYYIALIEQPFDELQLKKRSLHVLELATQRFSIEAYALIPELAIGISHSQDKKTSAAELLQAANTALTRARAKTGPAYELYTSQLDLEIYRRHQLEQGLRYAIGQDELFLEYQPKVDIWSGQLLAFEALIRWDHPEWGRIPPQDFIPLAEEGRFYLAIGDWVLETVCRTLQDLSTSGFPVVPISINLSAKRLLHGNFVETVKTCLKRHNIQARFLQFELPENVLLENNEFVKETLTHLHRLGIRLTLDRYGSSATSLACLRDYPITTLKLDRSFVAQLEEADQSTALLKTIIYFAKELELTVVAEGVETLHQLDLFRDFECHAVQGYLFSRPVSASELVNVLRLGVLSPIESLKASPKQQLPSVHAQVTITRLNGKAVNVGASPILITRSTNRSVHFYASIRLPVDHQIELSLQLKDVDHPRTIIEPLAITELDNGLFHYSADYKVRAQSILLMKALEHSEQQKLDDFFSLT